AVRGRGEEMNPKLLPLLLLFLTLAGCHSESAPAKPHEKVAVAEDDSLPSCCSELDRGKLLLAARGASSSASAAQPAWPMFGGSLSRNMVNAVDKGMPTDWAVEESKRKNIKWLAQLGSKAYGGPVMANGKVYVGTNNAAPRDKAVKGVKAVLMCFTEADGKFL